MLLFEAQQYARRSGYQTLVLDVLLPISGALHRLTVMFEEPGVGGSWRLRGPARGAMSNSDVMEESGLET